jgi:transcription elongation factor SPT5
MGDVFCDYFESNYYHDGYLLKEFTVGTMVKPCGEGEPPTLDELQRFRKRQKSASDTNYDDDDDGENEGSKRAASLLDELSELQGKTGLGVKSEESKGGLIIGDTVEVIEGDLVGLTGKLISLDGTTVKVKPNNAADLGDMTEVEFLVGQVRKLIPVGAHVKVTEGRYANETGIVVAVEQMEGETDCTAVVLTDMTLKEISGKSFNGFAKASHNVTTFTWKDGSSLCFTYSTRCPSTLQFVHLSYRNQPRLHRGMTN